MPRNKPGSKQRAAQPAAGSSSSSSGPGNAQVQKLTALLRNIKEAWRQHGKRFTSWWFSLDNEGRLKFLLDWCPYMPLARDKPYLFVDGQKEDVSGASLLTPEWNQADLAQGSALIELITATAGIPDRGEPGAAEGYDAVTELCLQHVPFARMVAPNLKSRLSPQVQRAGIVMLLPRQLGREYVVNQMVPTLQQWLEQGAAIRSVEWEALMLRLDVHLGSMAMCLDHYRVDVLGRDSYKAVGPVVGCAHCRAVQRSDGSGGRLLACAACGQAFYCSRDCQKAHWREHKPGCRPEAAKALGSSSSSQGAGASPRDAPEAEGGTEAAAAAEAVSADTSSIDEAGKANAGSSSAPEEAAAAAGT